MIVKTKIADVMRTSLLEISKKGLYRVSLFLLRVSVGLIALSAKSSGETRNQYFADSLFDYGYGIEMRDPALPLTTAELEVLNTENDDNLRKSDIAEWYKLACYRVGIIRAIGFQKREDLTPLLIRESARIWLPKSGADPVERLFPCIWALARIGDPALDGIQSELKISKVVLQRKLLYRALVGIQGTKIADDFVKQNNIVLNERPENVGRPVKRKLPEGFNSPHEDDSFKLRQVGDAEVKKKPMTTFAFISLAGILLATLLTLCLFKRMRKDL